MDFREQIVAGLRRRAELLPSELAEWQALTDQNRDGMGIHQSQIDAVTFMFQELIQVQQGLLDELDPALDAEELAEAVWELGAELSGAHGLMTIFRHILAQRLDTQRYRPTLDTADLVAAECYRSCIKRAQDFGALGEGECRVPPLTFLNAQSSPRAITRRHRFGAFGFDLTSYEAQPIPIPVISLRYHDATAVWSLCALYHEVGHVLDQDLGLRSEMGGLLRSALGAGDGGGRAAIWADQWVGELIADALGVLLGGAGFAYALAELLLLPASEARVLLAGEKHPTPYLRISLLGALLQQTGVPALAATADEIVNTWQSKDYYGAPPPALEHYLEDCKTVTGILVDERLFEQLKGRSLRDLCGDLRADHASATSLAAHLCGDGTAADPATFPARLVPAAAQLAVQRVHADHKKTLAAIQERTLAFRECIPHDDFMAPGDLSAEQEQHLRGLARKVRFSRRSE